MREVESIEHGESTEQIMKLWHEFGRILQDKTSKKLGNKIMELIRSTSNEEYCYNGFHNNHRIVTT